MKQVITITHPALDTCVGNKISQDVLTIVNPLGIISQNLLLVGVVNAVTINAHGLHSQSVQLPSVDAFIVGLQR
jgi:hypothetical protein